MEGYKCKFCGGNLENKQGCKPKKYCSDLCKIKQFQKDNPKGSKYVKILKSEYDELLWKANRSYVMDDNQKEVSVGQKEKKVAVSKLNEGKSGIVSDSSGEKPLFPPENRLAELQKELSILTGSGQFTVMRRKWVEAEIKKLK